ncbi:MAG: gluconate 2-dehydrogenase subunit 3 family protein [Flavobacteriaceae bacterium]|nr:gluconate 2-dehydrogenase subunit 3 family protein [Flavobacteriaceae bacterium]
MNNLKKERYRDMKRRDVLKGLGYSLSYAVAAPSVISLLQGCKNDTGTQVWVPAFFSEDQGLVIENLVDLILPKTDGVPGAIDLNIHKFFDAYVNEVAPAEDQNKYKKGFDLLISALGKSVNKCTPEDYDDALSRYLKAGSGVSATFEDTDKLIWNTLVSLRNISLWAFKTSEAIGKKVLAYDPIPGSYSGCIPLNETTGGKAWSL